MLGRTKLFSPSAKVVGDSVGKGESNLPSTENENSLNVLDSVEKRKGPERHPEVRKIIDRISRIEYLHY